MAYKDKEKDIKYKNDFAKEKYDHFRVFAKKGFKDKVKQAADSAGESLSAYIIGAVRTRMQSEGYVLEDHPDLEP